MTTPPWWLVVALSVIGLIPGFYAALDTYKSRQRRKREEDKEANSTIFKDSLEWLREYKKETTQLKEELNNARDTINQLNGKLYQARLTIDKLTRDLSDTNTELIALRGQVNDISKQVDKDSNGS